MKKLENKRALIIGGSRGIGFAISERFLQDGAAVAVCGTRAATAEEAVKKLKAKYPDCKVTAVHADIRSTEEVQIMFRKAVDFLGGLDILVNNAGITSAAPLDQTSDESFINMMDINVNGMFRCTREALQYMKEKGGSIINTSSMISDNGGANQCGYTASKFAVNGLTRSFARELGKYNIRVNAVAPGVVETDMVRESVTDQMKAYLQKVTALERTAAPAELAGAFAWLASEDASFATGAIIRVDGGIVH